MRRLKTYKPHIALFISIVSVSFAAIFIISCSSPPLSIAFYRMLFTTMLVSPLFFFEKNIKEELKSLDRRELFFLISIGVVLAVHFSLWITSLTLTSVASSVILVTAHPVLVAPISYFLLKEKLSFTNVIGISISLAGVAILVVGNYSFSSTTLVGNILAMLGGAAAGSYILGGRMFRKKLSTSTYVTVVYSISTITLLVICLLMKAPVYNLNPRDYWTILLMAVVAGLFGHTLYNWSLRYVKASVASVALLGEPIGSAFLAFILPWIHQVPTIYTIIGGVITLGGIYLTAKRYTQ